MRGVRNGTVSVEEAEGYFGRAGFVDLGFEDTGFARLDSSREQRCGFIDEKMYNSTR